MPTPLAFRCRRCGAMNRMTSLQPGREPICGKCRADLEISGAPAEVDLAALDRAVAASPVPVLVDFWAPWCAPCRGFAPVLDHFGREEAGRFMLLKVDTEAHPDAAARFRIQAIPTLVAFRGGREVDRASGALPPVELRRFASVVAAGAG